MTLFYPFALSLGYLPALYSQPSRSTKALLGVFLTVSAPAPGFDRTGKACGVAQGPRDTYINLQAIIITFASLLHLASFL